MNGEKEKNTKITAGQAVKKLKKSGLEVSIEEAEAILEMMRFLARLIIDQNFKK